MTRFHIPPITNSGLDLRDYQHKLKAEIFEAWRAGAKDVCAVSATGSGKTRTSASVVHEFSNAGVPTMIAAHRQELVGQLSCAMAAEGVFHNIIASKSTVRLVSNMHVSRLGRSFYHPEAPAVVSSVDTLIRRDVSSFADKIGLYVTDESHHLLVANKWGKCRSLFPNALGLGVTATPDRSDGHGLGRHASGFFDTLVLGPPMRDLIRQGYLTDYRIFCPPPSIDLSNISVTASGDYNRDQLKSASAKSTIVGDCVSHYRRIAMGKRGVTFVVSVEDAENTAEAFNAAGIPAKVLTGLNTDAERSETIGQLERGEILQIVAVDIISEGFDLPAIEVISFARPTQSYSLYIQMFGRALRPSPGKQVAIILDHVGNVERFIAKGRGLPDTPQQWSLDSRERGAKSVKPDDVISLTTCLADGCFAAYDSNLPACPWCGAVPQVAAGGRSAPERVDGELYEMPLELMAQLRGEADRIVEPDYPEQVRQEMLAKHAPQVGVHTAVKRAGMLQDAQLKLRGYMAQWLNVWERLGLPLADVQRMFAQTFGCDVLNAQTLGLKETQELGEQVRIALDGLK